MRPPYDVAVVGAGVSGCTCAAILAEAGASVLLLNSALDVVGLPAYGPDLSLQNEDLARARQVFSSVPSPLAAAWLLDGRTVQGDSGVVLVDRRAVSLRTKWLLESYPSLEMRQGLVVSVRPVSQAMASEQENLTSSAYRADGRLSRAQGRIAVVTGFGEEFAAASCVVAVGLSLQGRIKMGEQVLPGGRYGEVTADALAEDLAQAGVPFRSVSRRVGSRLLHRSGVGSDDPAQAERQWARRQAAAERRDVGAGLVLVSLEAIGNRSQASSPSDLSGLYQATSDVFRGLTEVPSPYDVASTSRDFAWLRVANKDCGRGDRDPEDGRLSVASGGAVSRLAIDGCVTGGIFPDGHAGDQWYASPGIGDEAEDGWAVVQPEHEVTGLTVVSPGGELQAVGFPGLWIAGQVGGAVGYLQSLASGAGVARSLLKTLRREWRSA